MIKITTKEILISFLMSCHPGLYTMMNNDPKNKIIACIKFDRFSMLPVLNFQYDVCKKIILWRHQRQAIAQITPPIPLFARIREWGKEKTESFETRFRINYN